MRFLVLLVALATGCTMIDYSRRVPGWPEMKIEVHEVDAKTMRDACAPYAVALSIPLACSEFSLNPWICRVFVTERGGFAEEHELAHCAGYEHIGSTAMQEMLEAELARQKRAAPL